MTDFRPQFTGFGPDVTHQVPRSAAPLPEQQPVTIISDNANRILDLVTEHGGSLSGDQLRAEVADLSPVDRRKAIGKLREEGRIVSTGATTRVTYYLPGLKRRPDEQQRTDEIAADQQAEEVTARVQAVAALVKPATPDYAAECIQVRLPDNVAPELQLMAALDFVTDNMFLQHFGIGLDQAAVTRATSWLASKYQTGR
jgi:hypothetical protein